MVHMRDDTPCRRGLPVGVYPIPSHSGTHTSQDGLKRVHLGLHLDLFHGLQKWFSMFYSWLELRRSGTRLGPSGDPLAPV